MKQYFLLVLVCFLWSCGTLRNQSTVSKDSIQKIIQDYEQLGALINDKFPSYWPNNSEEKLDFEESQLGLLKNRLQSISFDEIDKQSQINFELLSLIIEDRLFHIDFETHLFPLNSEGGFLAGVVYSTQNQKAKNEEAFEKYKEKLSTLPTYFKQRENQMRLGQQKGKSSPKIIVQNCLKLIEALLNTPIGDLFFMNAVKGDIQRESIILALIDKEIIPAYKQLQTFLQEEYLVNAPEEVGVAEIRDGKSFYEQRVRFFTTLDMSPKEIFETGQEEVKRIRSEMEAVIEKVGFEGSFADFLAFLRTDQQFYPKSPAALLEKAAWITTEMQGKLPQYFGKIPRMPLTVKPVPATLAPNYTGGRYSPGSYNRNRAGQYWVNTYKLESRPYYVLPALSLHEGVPGHHLQMMLSAEIEGVPNFRKNTYLSAFGEGWGLYSEYLGKEAGIYQTPYEDFGRLTYEMWRACRLVVDPGMHYMGWTRAEAIDFMASNTALSLHEVNTEIDRYIGWPGQAVSYKIGELKIRALREQAEKELGSKYDIRNFHDRLLENGSVPLSTLDRIIQEFIADEQRNNN